VFTSDRSGAFELYRMNADGSQQQMIPTPVEGM
jgi:Tol biopolymer transport system component